ncbi:hypothetical protein ABTY59_25725 [Streptomyces sp. NPDC096079]|uniref:hypothetical protein n=1 Tax=unclassified Streptomyces TaxID=2593676 RepID=UPI00332E987D
MGTQPAAPPPDSPAAPLPQDFVARVRSLWEELRDERANQYDRLDSLNVATSTLLGFEGILIVLVPGLTVSPGWRTAGMIALAISIATLLYCLLDMPLLGPKDWRKRSKRSLAAVDPVELDDYLTDTSDHVLLRLYVNEGAMVMENHDWLLLPKRRTLQAGVILFGVAFALLGVGALVQLWS